jgi:hypothetical protein
MKKFLITEDEQKYIRDLYKLNEQDNSQTNLMKGIGDYLAGISSGKVKSISTDNQNIESGKTVTPGKYFTHPNADKIKINYGANAIKLNDDAERLLKSIFAEADTLNLRVTSTLRTYDDQARVNLQNSRANISAWYGADVAQVWDKYKAGQMTQQQYANYLKDRDTKKGKLMSNHLSGLAIDVVPYSEKFASTADRLKKEGNSGIRKVLREKSNNAVHIEFTFPVTNKQGIGPMPSDIPTNKSEKRFDKAITKSGIIVDKKNESNKYAIIFGGSPSSKYGAQFMYQQGTNIFTDKNIIYSNFENPLETVINYVKSIVPNVEITSVSGFSAGGKNAWEAAKKGYKTGLIDPVVTGDAYSVLGSDLSGKIPSNIKMISRQENWSGPHRKHGESLSKIESLNTEIKRNVRHLEMPAQFFKEFESFV